MLHSSLSLAVICIDYSENNQIMEVLIKCKIPMFIFIVYKVLWFKVVMEFFSHKSCYTTHFLKNLGKCKNYILHNGDFTRNKAYVMFTIAKCLIVFI